ncbi:MAG TPA: HAD family phosphatase [Streptosporangiaceae bacterium]|nr:HAD family phosphatase [Streptosporangiaceae bacterium]
MGDGKEAAMGIRAVVLDIGGVLEHTPPLGTDSRWEQRLGLAPGEMALRLGAVWRASGIGAITEAEVCQRTGEILRLGRADVDAYLADAWTEYLGTLNQELAVYFSGLRPAYRTGIISNSSVGAREREQARYGFEQMTDVIIYSHEAGIAKPDPRIYALACQQLQVRPEEMVFLDDVQANVDAAVGAGIRAVLFTGTDQAIADIEARLR